MIMILKNIYVRNYNSQRMAYGQVKMAGMSPKSAICKHFHDRSFLMLRYLLQAGNDSKSLYGAAFRCIMKKRSTASPSRSTACTTSHTVWGWK